MKKLSLTNAETSFDFLSSGDLSLGTVGRAQINQIKGNIFDGSMMNLYLRIFETDGTITSYPLLGNRSSSDFLSSDSQMKWQGKVAGITYQVIFSLSSHNSWFWDVALNGAGEKADVILGQDVGLATSGSLLANEAYMSQYVDYQVFDDSQGSKVLCARQNQDQGGIFPFMQLGSLTGAAHYSTDGYQFFGKEFKLTNQPMILAKATLADEIYQYEMGYLALQSLPLVLESETHVNFYGLVQENHPEKISKPVSQREVLEAYAEITNFDGQFTAVNSTRRNSTTVASLNGLPVTEAEIAASYPNRKLIESDETGTLSFFGENNEHVVLQEKEKQVERSHGHIIMSGKSVDAQEPVLTSTSYMYGAFQSQVVLGNTSMNKFISNVRNPLNFFKTTGQRVYLKIDGEYVALGMPSLYEVGFNYSKWVYKLTDDQLEVLVYSQTDASEIRLAIKSATNKCYDFIVTQEIICDDFQTENKPKLEVGTDYLIARPHEATLAFAKYPEMSYKLSWQQTAGQVVENDIWFAESTEQDLASLNLVSLAFAATPTVELVIQGSLDGQLLKESTQTFAEAKADYQRYITRLNNNFKLSSSVAAKADEVERFNTVINWYTHNMLVHYLVPHGLEQFGGAAWGTRDVCQGPIEFFLATQNYDVVKKIMLVLFSHQFEETGNWPQWFMFDEFAEITAGESHGDIIVWPLKVVADYLNTTNDYSILDEKIPYMNYSTKTFSTENYTLLEHIEKEIAYIEANFLPGTYLSCYNDGDWDDTLQPFDSRLKEDMASTWTVALTYQTLRNFSQAIAEVLPERSAYLADLAKKVEADYRKYMLKEEILPGFVLQENNDFEYIIHPKDQKTGITYRLLPMTRSIISELLTEEEMTRHMEVINENLLFPDGVHLMNQPANYDGGVSQYFKRAEQAANFGREVGLQYVHAHIRYSEALAKIGKGSEMWQALLTINPILLTDYVKNAEKRQSNAYFSSSDGKFNTRYEAAKGFKELQTGKRTVKGGWRIYSSGPGIYINQLISNLLGVRIEHGHLVLDPVLAPELGNLTFEYQYLGLPLTIHYHQGSTQAGIKINHQPVEIEQVTRTKNAYRQGGITLSKELIERYRHGASQLVIDYYN